MLKKTLSLVLALSVLAAGALWAPVALAAETYGASTPLTGAPAAKVNNISLAIEAIDGLYIPQGGEFSFNELVGPRTKDRGFQTAKNGRGAKVTGGGVAQVAATLYLALLEVPGNIEFGPIKTYGANFTDSYVDDGDLAIITDYSTGTDLSFTNYAGDMSVKLWADDEGVHCALVVSQEETPDGGITPDGWSWHTPQPMAPQAKAVGSASFHCGDDANLVHNVNLAANSVDDTTLATGDVFSFNEIVGPRGKKYGYKPALNGRGVEVSGGGVAQVASAIWLSIKDNDAFSIIEKSTYGKKYSQDYVASSSDAILTDYNAGTDFSFRYTGTGSVTIHTRVEDGTLYCDIYAN